MKKINKLRIISLSLVMVVLTIVACEDKFLEVAPTASLTDVELTTTPGLEGTLIGAYSMLLGRSGFYSDATNWFWGSVMGGDANKGTNAGDQSQVNEIQAYSVQTNNASVNQKYRALYEGVSRANNTLLLALTPQEDVSAETLLRIQAEARFLRGHYYFDLKKIFDNTPFVDENWDGIELVSNTADVWPMIEADFKFAFDNLPETQGDAGRANKWAAGAYLGKALLFQGKFAEAKSMFDDVVSNGVTASGDAYGLVSNYNMAFRSIFDNNEEAVFQSQAAAGTGNINNANPGLVLNFPHGTTGPERPGGCCGFNQPSFDLVNSFRTVNGLPLLDDSYNSSANALVNDMTIASLDSFTPDAGNLDPRLDHSVGRRGIPYLDWGPHPGFDWIRDQAYGGPYSPKKMIYYKEGIGTENDGSSWTPGYTAVNYSIIRFADVLLMAAEAEIEAGSETQAMDYINQVRERAMNSPIKELDADGNVPAGDDVATAADAASYNVALYTAATFTDPTAALRMERKLELSGEGHRFFDLVRWGIAAETLNVYLANEDPLLASPFTGASFTANKNEFLPIPQNEIDLLGTDVLVQNEGY